MKTALPRGWSFLAGLLLASTVSTLAGGPGGLSIKQAGNRVQLSWPAAGTNSEQAIVYPEYELSFSGDLKRWYPVVPRLRGMEGRSGPTMGYTLEAPSSHSFFRVTASDVARRGLGDGGAETFGYQPIFAQRLSLLGRLSLEDFASNAGSASYLDHISWDPGTALYWTNFYTTNIYRLQYGGSSSGGGVKTISYNFRLDDVELPLFLTNGFVVSERMGSPTFGDAYYRLFNADLPVFITCDSVLHAWHRSYQAMLEETEELFLMTLLEQVVNFASGGLPRISSECANGPLAVSIQDADYILTVARSLLSGQAAPTVLGQRDAEVSQTLQDIQAEALKEVQIFGGNRWIDFSQFKVRGHYDASERLRRYFRTMMWLGRVDLRLLTFEPNRENDTRQFGTAVVLSHLIPIATWNELERVTRCYVGVTDSMTPVQLWEMLVNSYIYGPADVADTQMLTTLQTSLASGAMGVQDIGSSQIFSPLSAEQLRLARSYTVTGQKFVLDSWAMYNVVFDRVLWDPEDPTTVFGKVLRRKPSCLDVAFAVFNNSAVVPQLIERILNTNGVAFRDGYPYQHNLLAVRNTINGQKASAWTDNIYMAWLDALRALSAPTTNAKYPEAMRTRAWAMKNLNTQLASWTQLRHDTILYAKQSYTERVLCSYPAGFVEPRPEFWGKMKQLADVAAAGVGSLSLQGTVVVPSRVEPSTFATYDFRQVQAQQLAFLNHFGSQMSTLQGIASKELAQQPLLATETELFKNLIEREVDYMGVRRWNGWYPGLFYTNSLGAVSWPSEGWAGEEQGPGCDIWDALVTDVHTDLPDQVVGDPGAIIHEGVGNVHMMLIAIDNGPDRMVYAGPVFSHYEFEMPVNTRLSDGEWKDKVRAGENPQSPEWTRSYLAPGTIVIPTGY